MVFNRQGDETLKQIVQKGYRISVLRGILNRSGHGPEQPVGADPALSRVLDWVVSRGAFQPQLFCDSVKLYTYQF